MPKVSVIIPTFNRPELLPGAIKSVLGQTYQDLEIIIVDDGTEKVAEIVKGFSDERIIYLDHGTKKGGAAARNSGIKVAKGEYIAFLDDDDEWMAEKLERQMEALEKAGEEVAFSFTAVTNQTNSGNFNTKVFEGIDNYHERSLRRFAAFLTVTLVIRRTVIVELGLFDEGFPSHQEPELMIRVTEKYKGIGLNLPLALVNMKDRVHINSNMDNRIRGREMILEKYKEKFLKRPKLYAKHLFDLALFYRDSGNYQKASSVFWQSLKVNFSFRGFLHLFFSMTKYFFRKFKNSLLRIYLKIKFFGFRYNCPFCGGHFRLFHSAGFDYDVIKKYKISSAGLRENVRCPRCNSSNRERLIYLYLKKETSYFKDLVKALHIAPEKNLQKILKSTKKIEHISIDLSSTLADKRMDIMHLDFDNNSFDFLICSHVLEHIVDDITAMRELKRVLKPNGEAIILVPIGRGLSSTYEDKNVKTEKDRIETFGQSDHVRIYAMDIKERLASVGFEVSLYCVSEKFSKKEIKKYSLDQEECLFVCKKL